MRIFSISPTGISEASVLPQQLPASGYLWIACARREFEVSQAQVQATLQTLCGMQLVDLHIADLINNSLPSHYDYTSQYDVLVFRRLAAGASEADLAGPGEPLAVAPKRGGPPVLKRIDTSPVGFAVFDKVLLTVHPADCTVRDAYAARLLAFAGVVSRAVNSPTSESHAAGARLPTSPADLMLRGCCIFNS